MAGITVTLGDSLDVPSIVNQLIASESQPQALLQTALTTTQTKSSAYQSVNSRFASLLNAATLLTGASGMSATKATSSSTGVAVSSTSTAQVQQLAFDVTGTASAQSSMSSKRWTTTSDSYGLTSPLEVHDSTGALKGTVTIGGTGTLADMVTAINGSGLGLQAAAVQTAPGQFGLQVSSTATGVANGFTLGSSSDGSDADFTGVRAAADATLTVGAGTGAYTITSPSNTFTNVLPGVTFTVSKPETGVTLSVASNPSDIADKVDSLVNAVNAALTSIANNTSTATGSVAALKGDSSLRSLSSQLLSAVSSAVGSLGSPAQIGLQLSRDGQVVFDKAAFTARLTSDPTLAQKLTIGTTADPGIVTRIQSIASAASDSVSGTLVGLSAGLDSQATGLQKQIDDWTTRLANRQQVLTAQYSALSAALASLKTTSNWLTTQLDALTASQDS